MDITMKQRRHTGLRIEVDGDVTKLVGPRILMERILALPLLNYITMDGEIHTTIHDPLEAAGAIAANGALRQLRG